MRKSSISDLSHLPLRVKNDKISTNQNYGVAAASSSVKKFPQKSGIPKRNSSCGRPSLTFASRGRKSSGVYSNGRPSISDLSKKDSRPLHDRAFQQRCASQLVEFLGKMFGYNTAVKNLILPSQKEFCAIFEMMYKVLVPRFEYPSSYKLEEIIPRLFKSLNYPYVISKSHMQAFGAKHSWPYVLGALDWLRQLISYYESLDWDKGLDFETCHDPNKDYLSFIFTMYESFMQNGDIDENIISDLREKELSEPIRIVEELDAENQHLEIELEKALSEPNQLAEMKEIHKALSTDIGNMTTYLNDMEKYVAQKKERVKLDRQRHQLLTEELEAHKEEMQRQQHIFETQEMSADDCKRIQARKNQTDKMIRHVEEEITDINSATWKQETRLSNLMETLETIRKSYNHKARENQFIPESAHNAQGRNFDIVINFSQDSSTDVADLKILLINASKCLKEHNHSLMKDNLTEKELCERMEGLNREQERDEDDLKNRIARKEEELILNKHEKNKALDMISEEIKLARELIPKLHAQKSSKQHEVAGTSRKLIAVEAQRDRLTVECRRKLEANANAFKEYFCSAVDYKKQFDKYICEEITNKIEEVLDAEEISEAV